MWDVIIIISLLSMILFVFGAIFLAFKRTGTWKKWIIYAGIAFAAFAVFMVSVINAPHVEQQSNLKQNEQQIKEKDIVPSMDNLEIERFKLYVKNIKGSPFLKTEEILSPYFNTAVINYYNNYEDYISMNPKSLITEQEYIDYWNTGDAINKALMYEPIRLLREFPKLDNVHMILSFQGKTYTTHIDRKTIEKYLNVNLDEIHKDATNEQWRKEIVDRYFNDDEREKYVKNL